MAKRIKVEPTGPGEGHVLVQTLVVAIIERAGLSVDRYLELVRSGRLDELRRSDRFDSTREAAKILAGDPSRGLPDGLPEMKGIVSWRRVARAWSLDVTHVLIDGRIRFWSAVLPGMAQLSIEGVMLPDTMTGTLAGRPLRDVVEHQCITDAGIMIESVVVYKPTVNPVNGRRSEGSTQFQIRMPTIRYTDPSIES